MGTLASELGEFAQQIVEGPRVYADANLPAGLVRFMRDQLKWDVFFVMEQDDLRRARDLEHFRLAGDMRRTLITMDRDYLEEGRFPSEQTAGIVVLSAPNEEQHRRLLAKIDRVFFHHGSQMPLAGQKLHLHSEWAQEPE